jgi:IS30 family transposase
MKILWFDTPFLPPPQRTNFNEANEQMLQSVIDYLNYQPRKI